MSKTNLAILTVLAAAAGAAVHFVPLPYEPIVAGALTVLFAHYGVTFGKAAA